MSDHYDISDIEEVSRTSEARGRRQAIEALIKRLQAEVDHSRQYTDDPHYDMGYRAGIAQAIEYAGAASGLDRDDLVTVELTDLDDVTEALVNAIIHEGELRERERIIELLKPYTGWSGMFEADAADIIAHIKRENK